jgi:hypothetical protein
VREPRALLATIANESQKVAASIGVAISLQRRVSRAHLARDMQLRDAPPTTYSEAGHGEITQCKEGTTLELHAIRRLA